MATATRIYYINADGVERLVRATHPSAALMHVARDYTVRVASQDDLVNCLIEGVKPENAKEEAVAQPDPAPTEDKSLPLWPMPSPLQFGDMAPEVDGEGDEQSRPAQDGQAAGGIPPRQRMPVKYRCADTGSTWSGRGMKPTWLRVALERGKSLSDFEVRAETAEA